jgi:uncharacterized protein YjbJ (UPF0337 family)
MRPTFLEVSDMANDILEGKWHQMKGDLKKAFGKLTDDDIEQNEGNQEKLLGILQERYGYTREQAQVEWDRFVSKYSNKVHKVN